MIPLPFFMLICPMHRPLADVYKRQVCNCKIRRQDGSFTYKRVCKDGPVFLLREVMLDE